MNTRFCAFCGTGTQYTAVKPTFCSKCGKGFEAAFAAIVKPVNPTPAPVQYVPQPAPVSHRRFVGARGRDVPNPFAQSTPQEPVPYGGYGEDYVDRNAMLDHAEALASTINESDFVCGTDSDGEFHGRLPRIPTQQASSSKIRRRKKTV